MYYLYKISTRAKALHGKDFLILFNRRAQVTFGKETMVMFFEIGSRLGDAGLRLFWYISIDRY